MAGSSQVLISEHPPEMQAKKPPRARKSLFGPWSKYISSSRKTKTAPGSFGCVRLVPHFAQDDQLF
jgi:hypothetical protein